MSLCKPFYIIVKAFGLACYSFDKKTKALKATIFDKIYFATAIGLWVILLKIQLSKRFNFDYKDVVNSTLLNNLWLHQYIIQHICGLSVIIYSFFQQRKIGDILKLISNFDEKVVKFNCQAKGQENNFKILIISFVICVFILLVYVVIFSIENNFSAKYSTAVTIISCFNYSFVLLFYVVLSEQFIICAFSIRARISALHIKLR